MVADVSSTLSGLAVPNSPSTSQTQQSNTAGKALSTQPGSSVLTQIPVQSSAGALLGAGSTGAASVLGAFNGDDATSLFGDFTTTTSQLMQQVQATANARLADTLQTIQNTANTENSGINIQNDRWISVKAAINNAQIAVQNGQESVTKVTGTLLDMRTSLGNAGTPGEDLKYWKDQFDSQVNSINNEAESAGPATNLVGNLNPVDYSPNTIEYRNDVATGSTTLTGTYIGNVWRIKANDGTYWVPDVTTDTLQAYAGLQGTAENYKTTDGQTVAKATSTRNGLSLVSYNASTGDITVNVSVVPTDPPITVTGKLEQNGIGIMGSWFYHNFATQADRNRAFSDIDRAENNLVSSSATLQSAATATGQDQKRADSALADLTNQTVAVQTKEQNDLQTAQVQAAQQYLAMQANLQNLQSVQSNYLQAFSGFVDDPFAQTALSLIA